MKLVAVYLGSDHLSLLVHSLHGGRGEEREDETKGAHQVAWEGVDEGELCKDHFWTVEAGKQDH